MDDDQCVCGDCVADPFLRSAIGEEGEAGTCSFCQQAGRVLSLEDVADKVELVFERHFERTPDQPDAFESAMLRDAEGTYEWERKGEPVDMVIAEMLRCDDELAVAVREVLAERHGDWDLSMLGYETEYHEDSHYQEVGTAPHDLQLDWDRFEQELKFENRYFSRSAQDILHRVFKDLENHQTWRGEAVIRSAGPGEGLASFYRARSFQDDEQLEKALLRPDRDVGSPPATSARGGRMNAKGVSIFYGALDPETALAEIRPPVGSKVVVAKFDVIRPLKLLDVEALRSLYVRGSYFDPDYERQLALAAFLRRLSNRIAIPVMGTDEPSEYLITQVIADYLAAAGPVDLDGILFPSAQCGGTDATMNVALFHKASRVDALEVPEGADVTVSLYEMTEDGPEPNYTVIEQVPSDDESDDPLPSSETETRWSDADDSFDRREAALRLNTKDVQVHHVTAVKFTTDEHHVFRHRWKRSDDRLKF